MQTIEAISNVNTYEAAILRASLHVVFDDRFKCEKCPTSKRAGKYCETPSVNVHWMLEKDLQFKRCPGNYLSMSALSYLDWQAEYEAHGTLPYPGALGDQPAKIIDIFSIIEAHKRRVKEVQLKRAALRQGGRVRG